MSKRRRRGTCCKLCLCCCCLLVLLVAAALVAGYVFVRPPNVTYLGTEGVTPQVGAQPADAGFSIAFVLNFRVENPNLVGVNFEKVEGDAAFKDVSPVVLGTGQLYDVAVPRKSDQVLAFPVTMRYSPSNDPGGKIILYVANRCGVLGGPRLPLEVAYTVRIHLALLSRLGIVPSFSGTASFDCPLQGLTPSSIPGFAAGASPAAKSSLETGGDDSAAPRGRAKREDDGGDNRQTTAPRTRRQEL